MPLAFVCLAAAGASRGEAPGYQITAGFIETNNVQLVPTGGSSDTLASQQVQLDWHDQRTRLDTDIDADLMHITYLRHTFGDQVIGNFLGRVGATLIPQLLVWNTSDNFGQSGVDPFQAVTPATIENVNNFSTGPRLLLPLGSSTNLLDLDAQYGNVNYQKSPLDSQRFSEGIGFIHVLSARSSLSISVHNSRIDYSRDDLSPDYDSQEALVRFDAQGSRTTFGADVGYGKLVESSTSTGNAIGHLQLSRKMSAASSLSLSLGREYSDAASQFVLTQTLGGANLNSQPTVQTGVPFMSDYATLGWNFARARTAAAVSVSEFKDVYQLGAGLNDNRTQANGNVSRKLTPTVELALEELFLRDQFENTPGSYSQTTSDIKLVWRAGSRLSVNVSYAHTKRQSNLPGTDYTENRVWLSLGYGRPAQRPPGPATPPLPRQSIF